MSHLKLDISANCFAHSSFMGMTPTMQICLLCSWVRFSNINNVASHSLVCWVIVQLGWVCWILVQLGWLVVWRKSRAGGRVVTTQPLLSALVQCRTVTTSIRAVFVQQPHMCRTQLCVVIYTDTHTVLRRSQFVIMYLQCDCALQPCLRTTANSLRGVNLEQLQTPLKTIENLKHSPKF